MVISRKKEEEEQVKKRASSQNYEMNAVKEERRNFWDRRTQLSTTLYKKSSYIREIPPSLYLLG